MIRSFATLAFCAVLSAANAQSTDIKVTDTDAMRANAAKHTALVDQAVTLDDEQKERVQEVYMQVERQVNALNQRFDSATNMTPEVRKENMEVMWKSMDQYVETNLAGILTPAQAEKWSAASR